MYSSNLSFMRGILISMIHETFGHFKTYDITNKHIERIKNLYWDELNLPDKIWFNANTMQASTARMNTGYRIFLPISGENAAV